MGKLYNLRHLYFISLILFSSYIFGQTSDEFLKKDLTYYLPDVTYNKSITTPEQYFGFQIGEWHVSHDRVVGYMELLASQSDRVHLHRYAKSHEQRQLLTLYISDPSNIKNREDIKARHNKLTEDANASIENLPVVLYQGYSIHGNEPSGINAAMLNAYYLVAGESEEVKSLLKSTFIILDPCYNPDGVTRFSTWANSHKGNNLITDPASREYNEAWPGGRTNHYWFDLNRDWLLLTHPESRGRVKHFQEWKPNILTDHHEMGSNSTFFFQPGVPSRVNPNTPWSNQELTEEIATYHAKALDAIGSLYYSKEGFDDYYYGKGSTYPDIHGGVGILFEQASSRGHSQETENGILTFPFTIRNQVATSLSTQKAAFAMHDKLLEHKRNFYANLPTEIASNPIKGYIFQDDDKAKVDEMIKVFLYHDIKIYESSADININSNNYKKGNSYFIPLNQKQYKLIKTSFEKVKKFQDSIFYDVSAWTIPLAYDITYDEMNEAQIKSQTLGQPIKSSIKPNANTTVNDNSYGYSVEWNQAYAPAYVNTLLQKGILIKTITEETKINGNILKAGTILIPANNQVIDKTKLIELLKSQSSKWNVDVKSLSTGSSDNGLSMGHPNVKTLEDLKVFTIIGQGISSYDAGELWHYMDHRLGEAITMIDKKDLGKTDFAKYNTLVLVDGNYNDLSETFIKKLEDWVRKGNTIIALSTAIEILKNRNFIKLSTVEETKIDSKTGKTYIMADEAKGAKVVGGCILNAEADITHPLCFGMQDNSLALFKQGTTSYKTTENENASPIKYKSKNTVLSGYSPQGFENKIKGSVAATVHSLGDGTIINFADNVLFRGYWWGGFKVFSNALFFAKIIEKDTKEKN